MTDYYVRVLNDGISIIEKFWAVEKTLAHEDIVPSQLGTHHAEPGEDIMTTLRKGLAEFERELICARTGEGRERAKRCGLARARIAPPSRQCLSRPDSSGSRTSVASFQISVAPGQCGPTRGHSSHPAVEAYYRRRQATV
jgi:hypothetical protein